eukprot:scaffold5636_cov135-Skeletonema_menzelii.AAC.1
MVETVWFQVPTQIACPSITFRPRNLTFPYQIPWSIAKLENQIPRSRPNSEVNLGISNSDFPRHPRSALTNVVYDTITIEFLNAINHKAETA